MKIKISITQKLFIITAVVFTLFIGSTLLVQSLFFEKFYIDKKGTDLQKEIEKFKAGYLNPETNKNLDEFVYENFENLNMKFSIADKNGKIRYISKPVRNRFDMTGTLVLSDYIKKWNLEPGNLINIKQKIDTITPRFSPEREKYLVGISPLNETNEIIFGLTSLQPVNEATSVIRDFYVYFSIGAIIIIIILAFIYSNIIAKPLIKINRTATKMSQLDFSQKCEISSKDEFGNVASSLNFLSENLNNALISLKDANAKLEKDIEIERNLEKMRKEFIASVSHELKTPISLIDGYANGLKDNIFDGKEKDYYLDIIMDESKKMGRLVSDMLDLSQLESGSFKLIKEQFSLSELISYTLKKYETLIAEKPAELEINLIDQVVVDADWYRLEQVITNFITNALRHVSDNGRISVNMIKKDTGISVEIENTGSGIPESDLEKIWDKFYRIDKSGNKKLGGTGIGLSIVKNILLLHNYPFGIQNTEIGVKFYFLVPNPSDISSMNYQH
jgi:signal transduction histidine kinase